MNVINSLLEVQQQSIQNRQLKKKVKQASVTGSALGISASVLGIYALAKWRNPNVNLKAFNYSEKDVLMIGLGSVLGGLAGGLIADKNKNNKEIKLREASQQFFGNMMFPIGFLAAGEKILDKTGFKLPLINTASKCAKYINPILKGIPKCCVIAAALIGGMETGNKVMNKVNNKIFKKEVKHDVHAEDYLVHADDLCLAANFLLKDSKAISSVTSKVLPWTFIVAGSKTGMQAEEI